jgi:hypothetical protein
MSVITLRPNSDVSIEFSRSTGSYNYACVDEATLDLNDYVYCEITRAGTTEYCDTYGLSLPDKGSGPINSITVHIVEGCDSSFYGDVIGCLNGYEHPTPQEIIHTWGTLRSFEFTTNPATSGAWTWDDLDDITVGVIGRQADASLDVNTFFVYQVYVEVDYDYAWRGTVMDVENPLEVMDVADENISQVMDVETKKGED